MASKVKKNFQSNRKFNKNAFKNSKSKPQMFSKKPKSGNSEDEEIRHLQTLYDSIDPLKVNTFADLPLSTKTKKGLKQCNYQKPTEIQKQSIGHALRGRDVLGAAITGSGKTLAFLVPVMENLFLKKWSRTDGIGAIIISPTRELAYQIFETLKKVGASHDFSAGLIIGGKNLKFERSRMDQCNIIICTPGRLLQHMDENPLFNCSSMQVLVLDEADRCLDMGFEVTMNAIIENLPPERQTLLFSATQTKSVKDLARLSLTHPEYVAPHEQSEHSTPAALQQNYVVLELEEKLTMLWSFIKNHLKQKIIVFLSSCKQVKYFGEILNKLRPGTSVLALHGTLHQDRRLAVYTEFCRKSNCVLLATDVASRGLDFPVVNWVIQLDCPEDATAYIHRAGRTARHTSHGESLLVLLPSEEEAMVEELKSRKIPINKIEIDPKRLFSPRAKMESFLAQNNELKMSAQRAFIAYVKSVVLMKNKKIFQVDAINTDEYAKSLGLAMPPRIRFLQRMRKNQEKNKKSADGVDDEDNDDDSANEDGADEENSAESEENSDDSDSDASSESEGSEKPCTSTKSTSTKSKSKSDDVDFTAALSSDDDDEDSDSFMRIKRRDHEISEDNFPEVPPLEEIKSRSKQNAKPVTKAALAKKLIKKKIQANKKVMFDEDGAELATVNTLRSELAKEYVDAAEGGGIDIEMAKQLIQEEDKFDKARFKSLVKERKKTKKQKGKDTGEQDDFGSGGDESDGPDLSWVPDPDKLRGNADDVSDSDDGTGQYRQVVNSSSDDDSDGGEVAPASKRKARKSLSKAEDKKQSSESEDSDEDDEEEESAPPPTKKLRQITSKLSVNEAEQFAMQLLQG